MIYSMLLLFIHVVIAGIFDTPGALQAHATPQMCTPSNSTVLQKWEKNRCSVVLSLERSVDVTLKHSKGFCLGSFQTATVEGWSLEDERLVEFSSVVTNSSGALIGGSCTGGVALFCVVIYILYRLLKPEPPRIVPDTRSEPIVIHVQPASATNQNGTVCPRCRNAPSSPPPSYHAILFLSARLLRAKIVLLACQLQIIRNNLLND
ncbi:hypothetical protein ACROYT_G024489 [Oculina patagonica]